MDAKTALAVAGSVLAVPSAALAAADHHANVTDDGALHPSGKLAQDARLKQTLVREHVRLARRSNVRRPRTHSMSVLRKRNHRLRMRVSHLRPATPARLQAIAL